MTTIDPAAVKKLVVACDAGMGSSAMLASTLKKQLAKSGIAVEHTSVQGIPADADLVLTHAGLLDRARGVAGSTPVVPFNLFLGDPAVTKVVTALQNGRPFDV
ncbi:PTS lactose transporter subunit IIB [Actinotalea sp. M2MS4P-6]|uniref:PTS lactose transporter subunit IIB n=1 Tax=Actinotalea sp. M2MS4P-6 TaxID=2983762 RepID=UPI0021E3E468|nr:PTS lactose transporter subunit IIB [Actinotalea sp. M2MS4P-6]MCV2395497.1 PTS lactose transporter subunit IIB [Actinotalea sp. M2MS4P-6]